MIQNFVFGLRFWSNLQFLASVPFFFKNLLHKLFLNTIMFPVSDFNFSSLSVVNNLKSHKNFQNWGHSDWYSGSKGWPQNHANPSGVHLVSQVFILHQDNDLSEA